MLLGVELTNTLLMAGVAGGMVRGLVGYLKYYKAGKVRFNGPYFAITVILSGVIGFFAAWVGKSVDISVFGMTVFTPPLAFILGYAGGDFIENLVKIILGKTTLLRK